METSEVAYAQEGSGLKANTLKDKHLGWLLGMDGNV